MLHLTEYFQALGFDFPARVTRLSWGHDSSFIFSASPRSYTSCTQRCSVFVHWALGRSVGTGFNHLCMRWLVWWLQGLGFEWRRLLLSNWYHWHQVAALARLWYFNNIFSFNILIKVLNKNDTLKLIHNVKFNNLCTRGLGKGCPCRFSQSLRKPCRWPFCIAEQFCGQEVCTLRFPLWRPSSLLLCRLHGPRRS